MESEDTFLSFQSPPQKLYIISGTSTWAKSKSSHVITSPQGRLGITVFSLGCYVSSKIFELLLLKEESGLDIGEQLVVSATPRGKEKKNLATPTKK